MRNYIEEVIDCLNNIEEDVERGTPLFITIMSSKKRIYMVESEEFFKHYPEFDTRKSQFEGRVEAFIEIDGVEIMTEVAEGSL